MGRIDRQRVLYDESKRFRFVIPEAVLRWPYGPPDDPAVLDEHREQLARVEWATGRPNVEVGILPLAPVAVWRTAGFVIFDEVEDGEPQVHLEWLTRPYNIFEPDQVEMCRAGVQQPARRFRHRGRGAAADRWGCGKPAGRTRMIPSVRDERTAVYRGCPGALPRAH